MYFCNPSPNPFPWFFVRTTGDPIAAVESVRVRLHELEPLRSVYEFSSLDRRIADVFAQNRLRAAVLTVFSVSALLLAAVGIHGTLSYFMSLRRREIGLRLALGALAHSIAWRFVGETFGIVSIAFPVGTLLALAAARTFSSLLYGTTGFDPLALLTVAGLVSIAAVVSALGPMIRASRVDPLIALKHE